MDELKYPVGKFRYPEKINSTDLNSWIRIIEEFPAKLRGVVENLSDEQLALHYRPGGWNISQVVHHLADSHMNSFIRFKLALTEDKPVVKGYEEALWAEMEDVLNAEIDISLQLIDSLHQRWVILLQNMNEADWIKVFVHPESKREISLGQNLALYAWHCDHHYAHIQNALSS